MWLKLLLVAQGAGETHPVQHILPSQGAHVHPHSVRLGQLRKASSPHAYIFGMWNHCIWRKHMHTWGEAVFIFIFVSSTL